VPCAGSPCSVMVMLSPSRRATVRETVMVRTPLQ
jgi:hypothetical protein